MIDLRSQRFYRAKSEPIDAVEVAASAPAGDFEWQLLSVRHGGVTDTYQVLVDATSADALDTAAGASAYLDNVSHFGTVHGTIAGATAEPMGAEQSNTSLVVDDEWVLKVFRCLEDGVNPDVELLTGIADCPNVAGVRGHVTRGAATIAMQQQLIRDGFDGFDLATSDAGIEDPGELGEAIRTVHEALAEAFGTETVPGAELARSLNEHLDHLVAGTPVLREVEPSLRELYAQIPHGEVEIQRIHGDLHLGQTLKTPQRWFLIDFEGEPARPLAERRRPDHTLRDVAGMVRSFGYAAAVAGRDDDWEQACVGELLAGYGVERDPILAAYIADKAAYEVAYEANNRPDWVGIPLAAIRRLADA